MLKVEAVNLFYGAAQALRSVSISAAIGRVTCVLGRNGVGKTSLMRAIIGHQPIRDGSIQWEGEEISGLPAFARARKGFGYVPQGREIFPLLTVRENLQTGLVALPRDQRTMDDEVFNAVPGAARDARPARRRSLGRPAAATRHRPRAADARRNC